MKKIAVMLPDIYRGGSLRAAKNVAKGLAFQARELGDDIQVIFSYVSGGKYNVHVDFDDLKEFEIALRETTWQIYPRESLQAAIVSIFKSASAISLELRGSKNCTLSPNF